MRKNPQFSKHINYVRQHARCWCMFMAGNSGCQTDVVYDCSFTTLYGKSEWLYGKRPEHQTTYRHPKIPLTAHDIFSRNTPFRRPDVNNPCHQMLDYLQEGYACTHILCFVAPAHRTRIQYSAFKSPFKDCSVSNMLALSLCYYFTIHRKESRRRRCTWTPPRSPSS